ncbi:MAG: NF038122 family metalloprotease [Blastocatellia bacterium]|nr:NF038122 family metalloprotease [Blastocatellia bacterium]
MNFRRGRVISVVCVILASCVAVPLWRQQAQSPRAQMKKLGPQLQRAGRVEPQTPDDALADGHILVRTESGVECRQATAGEARAMRVNERAVDLHALVRGGERREAQTGLKITLRGTQQLENFPAAKQAFQRAAAKWEALIRDRITIIIDVDFGTTAFGQPYPSANTIGITTQSSLSVRDAFDQVRGALLSLATTPQQIAAFSALPVGALPVDLGSTANVGATSTQFRALGALDSEANPSIETPIIGPPPSIAFNSALPFDFDPSDGIDANALDFEATAVHEIGHAMGFVSNTGLKELLPTAAITPTLWDLFRFRPGGLTLNSITSQARVTISGGSQIWFAGDAELGFSTGDPQGNGGDGRQASHWRDDRLSGQYVGVMDPTAISGQPDYLTASDLAALSIFGYDVNPDSIVYELPSVDDNTREDSFAITNAIVVNRFTPSRYPSTLQGLRIHLPPSVSAGQSLRVVAFVDANRTGQPPANPAFIVDRTVTLPAIPPSRFLDIPFPTPPSIAAGDVYIGIQSAATQIAVDADGPRNRQSFISTNNGASFELLQGVGFVVPINFMARAILTNRYGATPTPGLASISPSATAPGGAEFTLFARGSGFRATSTVRWNGVDRPTTFVSGTELRAQIPAADIANAGTARVTVFTAGVAESAGASFGIAANNPAPTIARLSPSSAPAGASSVNLTVFGSNFTPQSVVRFSRNPLPTTRVSSVQLSATLPAAALASSGLIFIDVTTPAPGGGDAPEVAFTVLSCSYTFATGSQTLSSVGGASGIVFDTFGGCPWTASADQSWVTLTGPSGNAGTGRSVINYQIAANTAAAARTATLTAGGAPLTLRQVGRGTGVSAASFSGAALAPNSIIALFGAGLAKETTVASTQPLPTDLAGTRVTVLDAAGTSRAAQLFFVSPGQVNLLVPTGTVAGTARASITVDGNAVADGSLTIAAVAPALFSAAASGQGVAAAVALRVKADGTQIFEPIARFDQALNRFVPIPIDLGPAGERVFLLLYGSGFRGRSALSAVSLKIGDLDVPVSFAGAVDGLAGLDQLNAELLRALAGKGDATIVLTVDGRVANSVTVNVK